MSLRPADIPVSPQFRDRLKKEKKEMTYEQFLQKLLSHHKKCGVFT